MTDAKDDLTSRLATMPDEITTDDGITVWLRWNATWYRPSRYQANAYDVLHGHCARLVTPGGRPDPFPDDDPPVGSRWPAIWRDGQPTAIHGIDADEMPAAVTLLIDTGRAFRAWQTASNARIARTITVLSGLRTAKAAALTEVPAGPERWMAVQGIQMKLHTAARRALLEELADTEQISKASGFTADQLAALRGNEDTITAPLVLDDAGFAARLGISLNSFRSYKSRGRVVAADRPLGGSDGWSLPLVEAYIACRPPRQ